MAHAASFTLVGRSILVNRIKGGGTEPLNIGWGVGTATGAANSDVALFQPGAEARVAGTSTGIGTSFLSDTYQVTGAITATAGRTITEVGLFVNTNATPQPTLAASITASATSATLSAASTAGNYFVQMNNEVAMVTGGQGTSIITFTRAQLGSAAAIQPSGTAAVVGGDGGAFATFGVGPMTGAAVANAMFLHADFAPLILNSGDSILFTITDQFSGA